MKAPNNQPELRPRFIDPRAAAELLGLSVPTVLRMCRQGQINARKFRKKWRIPMSTIDELEHCDIPMEGDD